LTGKQEREGRERGWKEEKGKEAILDRPAILRSDSCWKQGREVERLIQAGME